jgi:hypothetical protein
MAKTLSRSSVGKTLKNKVSSNVKPKTKTAAKPTVKARSKPTAVKAAAKATAKSAKPKRLSKIGEWMEAHPNGLDVIYIDWKAVMK